MNFRRIRLVLAALLLVSPFALLIAAPAGNAQTTTTVAPTPEAKAAATVEPAIVYLSLDMKYYLDTGNSGLGYIGPYELQGSCTGVNISSDGYIETAGHCVDVSAGSTLWNAAIQKTLEAEVNAGSLTITNPTSALNEALGLWKVEGASAGSTAEITITVAIPLGVSGQQGSSGKTARVVEAKSFADGDVALIKTEETNAPIVQLGSDSDVDIGTPVLAIGYPGAEDGVVDTNLTPTFKDGQINAKSTRAGLRVPVYEMSADLSPGMSGGPTVALDGKLVGINSFSSSADSNFDFISPVSLVKEQLSRNNVKNELGVIDTSYREGLDSYFAGDYEAAVASFDKVLGVSPGHYYAQQFKQKSNEKLASAPPTTVAAKSSSSSSSSTLWIVLGILAVLVIVVIVVIIVLMGRGKKGAAGTPPPGAPGYGAVPPPGTPPGSVPPPPTAPAAPTPTEQTSSVATAPPPTDAPTAPTAPMAATTPGAATTFCASCGRQLSESERFCPGCGHDRQE